MEGVEVVREWRQRQEMCQWRGLMQWTREGNEGSGGGERTGEEAVNGVEEIETWWSSIGADGACSPLSAVESLLSCCAATLQHSQMIRRHSARPLDRGLCWLLAESRLFYLWRCTCTRGHGGQRQASIRRWSRTDCFGIIVGRVWWCWAIRLTDQ